MSFIDLEVLCVQGQHVWRKSYSEINDELSKGYKDGNTEGSINEIMAGEFHGHVLLFWTYIFGYEYSFFIILLPTQLTTSWIQVKRISIST